MSPPPVASVLEIEYRDPLATFASLADEAFAIFLDSSLVGDRQGRYSYIAVEPFLTLSSKNGRVYLDTQPDGERQTLSGNPFDILRAQINRFPLATRAGLPSFQTGVAGYFGYDLCHHLEQLPAPARDDLQFPDLVLGFYDVVVAFDHRQMRAWIISSGFPEQEGRAQRRRAQTRLESIQQRLLREPSPLDESVKEEAASKPNINRKVTSNFERPEYEAAVQRVIDYIYAGDIFQANLSQRFSTTLTGDPFNLYVRLRRLNPAPFSAYLNFRDVVIASASPERFLRLRNGWVETRPIKGTRPRGATQEQDEALARELLASEKDRAENVMIVDLLRNDLSRICRDRSVRAPEICTLESFASVHHLVSTVEGRLKPEMSAVDLMQAAFPGGSITGAPKIRAMEIIAELEPTRRGPYCGCVGYLGFDGNMDTSITIRTFAIKNNVVTFQAGGAIVSDSSPAAEYEETLTKAKALMDALDSDVIY